MSQTTNKRSSDQPVLLTPAPEGYADWLPAELQSSLPSIEQIERELAGDDSSTEDEEK